MCNIKECPIECLRNPYEDIFQTLKSPWTENANARMFKLWADFIGEKVLIYKPEEANEGNLIEAVCTLFTSDPIAYRLMAELILYKPDFDRIIVSQGQNGSLGMIEFLKNAKMPVLVFESHSKFATAITTDAENDRILHLSFWEINNSKLQNVGTSDAEDLWAKYSRDKVVIGATNATRKANIRKMLNSQVGNWTFVNAVTQYAPSVDRITIKQSFESNKVDKQALAEMVTLLKSATNPNIVFIDDYAIVMSTNPANSKNILMDIWDLKISI